tara:strand:+ start:2852 stop:3412 length:561 start_codon:yes stop_codon:yes gene_type:complete
LRKKKYIGILGGTFDPPHSGHFYISRNGLIKLGLDEIWWIVTKQNPFKDTSTSIEDRYKLTLQLLKSNKIKLIKIPINETFYTINSINYLKKKFPNYGFLWMMGIDNVVKFHLWKQWKKIFSCIPIAIFDRPFYSLLLYKSKALSFYRGKRIKIKEAKLLKLLPPPRWVFLTGFNHSVSSTKLRMK